MENEKPPSLTVLPSPGLRRAARNCPLLEDGAAKEEWSACCTRRFWPVAQRIAGEDDLAMDVLQTSWIKILEAVNVSVAGPTACAWVGAVVANSAKDARRRRLRRREIPLAHAEDREAGPRLESLVQERQLRELLREMVAMLPATYRQVIELRVYRDLSVARTAEELRISQSNVRTRLHRAVAMLQRRIDKHVERKSKA